MAKLRVNSLTGKPFRRNGVTFTGVPQVVDTTALGWTDQMVAELRGAATGPGRALHVEDTEAGKSPEPGTPVEAVVAAKADGETLPGSPTVAEAEAVTREETEDHSHQGSRRRR
jgi:hypothetical protein